MAMKVFLKYYISPSKRIVGYFTNTFIATTVVNNSDNRKSDFKIISDYYYLISGVLIHLLQKFVRMAAMPNQAQLLVKIVVLVFNVHKTEWNHLFFVVMVLMPTQPVYQVVKPVQQVIIVVIHV